jgi:hypothetical protein
MSGKKDDKLKREVEKALETLQRNSIRVGKKALSPTERIEVLNQIYDGLLYSLQAATIAGNMKGTAAAGTLLERLRVEVTETLKSLSTSSDDAHIMTYEYDLPLNVAQTTSEA